MKFNVEKMKEISRPMTQDEQQEIENRNENRDWLALSAKFALLLRHILRTEKMTQTELAARMGVSCVQVTKLLSGKENIGLQTIAKVEKALGRSLVTFRDSADTSVAAQTQPTFNQVLSFPVFRGHTDFFSVSSQTPGAFSRLYTGKILV
jgi:plasmid maintenance system antidote protein VapI